MTLIWGQFHKIPEPSITKISLKIIHLKFHQNLQGANELTHLAPQRCSCNLKLVIFKHILRNRSQELPLCEYHETSLISDIINISSGTVMAWRHRAKAITWDNVDPDLCRHMVSLDHNELIYLFIFFLHEAWSKWLPFLQTTIIIISDLGFSAIYIYIAKHLQLVNLEHFLQ